MSDMLYETLFIRLSVLQIILFGGICLGAYIFYLAIKKHIQGRLILTFIVQILVSVVVSYLTLKILRIHN